MSEEGWTLSQAFWVEDASLVDVYVLETTSDDWKKFLGFVRREYPTEYSVDLKAHELPEDPGVVFEEKKRAAPLLKVFVGDVQLNCHFFTPEEIELDIDPSQVESPAAEAGVLRLIDQLGTLLRREVILTAESSPNRVFYRFIPEAGSRHWSGKLEPNS